MIKLKEDTFLFFIGSILYSFLELAWRGHTHWTMGLTGGTCLILMYRTDMKLDHDKLWKKCAMGSGIITSLEFIVGCIVNKLLNWHVWDYSKSPFNVLGQICLPFSVLWFMLSAPVALFCSFLNNYVFKSKSLMQN